MRRSRRCLASEVRWRAPSAQNPSLPRRASRFRHGYCSCARSVRLARPRVERPPQRPPHDLYRAMGRTGLAWWKRQIHHTKGLAHCRCRRRNSKSVTRIVMLPLSAAALAYARQPGFSALIFSDVKPPTGQSAAYKQSAADDLQQMGLTVLTENTFFGKPTGRHSERTTMEVVAQYTDGRAAATVAALNERLRSTRPTRRRATSLAPNAACAAATSTTGRAACSTCR